MPNEGEPMTISVKDRRVKRMNEKKNSKPKENPKHVQPLRNGRRVQYYSTYYTYEHDQLCM